jgi:hypothetical protein
MKKTAKSKKANASGPVTLDFSKYRAKKNPYAKRIAREGIELVHDGPSNASLAEIPELGPARRTTLFASLQNRNAKTIQLDAATWKKLEKRARAEKMQVDDWVRRLIAAVA